LWIGDVSWYANTISVLLLLLLLVLESAHVEKKTMRETRR